MLIIVHLKPSLFPPAASFCIQVHIDDGNHYVHLFLRVAALEQFKLRRFIMIYFFNYSDVATWTVPACDLTRQDESADVKSISATEEQSNVLFRPHLRTLQLSGKTNHFLFVQAENAL